MHIDVVLVLYNSAAWLPRCVAALAASEYDLQQLHLCCVDNASTDGSAELARRLAAQHPAFGSFCVLQNARNEGFGRACNRGAAAGSSPWVFFLNPDCQVAPGAFAEMAKGVAAHPDAGGLECRQLPYEMDHTLDPVSLEVPWASGAAFLVRREAFDEVQGFDPHLFLYCEDVDLSWRLRAAGHPIYYLPRAVVRHGVLQREDESASELREYTRTELGRLLLSYKYLGLGGILRANRHYLKTLRAPRHYPGVRRVLAKQYLKHFAQLWPFFFWRFGHRQLYRAAPVCLAGHFAPVRGREVLEGPVADGPLISVVLRTHRRPQVLRSALQSIANQTYQNYEVIVVEDGEDTARQMVAEEFAHLPLRYHATGQNVGRGRTGNIGLSMARGEYLNFLDDDDFFYPEHLEMMATKAIAHPEADLVIGRAMVLQMEVTSKDPYRFEVRAIDLFRFDRVDVFTMCQNCQIPIQSAMFKKSLYESCGGLHEEIDGYEDWAMWLKFLMKARRIDPQHVDIHRATSAFLIPYGRKEADHRADHYGQSYAALVQDPSYHFEVTLAQLRGFYSGLIADIAHLNAAGGGKLDEYLAYYSRRDERGHT